MVLETLRATYKGDKKKVELEEELMDFCVVGGDASSLAANVVQFGSVDLKRQEPKELCEKWDKAAKLLRNMKENKILTGRRLCNIHTFVYILCIIGLLNHKNKRGML